MSHDPLGWPGSLHSHRAPWQQRSRHNAQGDLGAIAIVATSRTVAAALVRQARLILLSDRTHEYTTEVVRWRHNHNAVTDLARS
jgi:hypothetical protein